MIFVEASEADIRKVFAAVPPARAAELTATAWHDDPQRLAEELILTLTHLDDRGRRAPMFSLCTAAAGLEARAIIGCVPFGPGLAGMIWAATEQWQFMALPSHRWWRRTFVPLVLSQYRRVEFTALAADAASQRWLAGLGFTEEGIAYRQGKRGEDFVHFAWINPDYAVGTVP